MRFNRKLFEGSFESKLRRALMEAAQMDYVGNSSNIDSISTSGSLYPDDDDFLTPTPPPDPNTITPEEKRKIYTELRYQELIAFALGLGWKADQINSIREIYHGINMDDPMDYGRPDRSILTDDLRRFLRRQRGSKNILRSKIDKKDILEMCESVYDTAVKLTLKNARRLKISKASAKIHQCADELRKKVCNSVAISLSNRRDLSGWQRTANNLAGIRHLSKILADPLGAGEPDYPYSEDY